MFSLGWCLGVWLSVLHDPFSLTNDLPYLNDSKMHIFFTFSYLWNQNVPYNQWHFTIPVGQEAVEREMSLPYILTVSWYTIKNICLYMPQKALLVSIKLKFYGYEALHHSLFGSVIFSFLVLHKNIITLKIISNMMKHFISSIECNTCHWQFWRVWKASHVPTEKPSKVHMGKISRY